MNKPDPHKPPDGGDPAGSEPPGDAALAIQERIGRELRAMFAEVVSQPVPEKLRQLLEELERKQSKG